ncbi:MAG: 1,2-diacylglycerol 3-glucosyltransferase, partial [Candidatus Omnitrophota bacterium]|nr:1,2-diacylglycerol 3-glucosyltransferase [Candidatus Omnitrophota bacterium]
EWMAVSDAMVSKPGGLSIAEALAMQLPLVFFNAIPGQETNNIRVLKHYGIGVNTNNIEDIVAQMEQWKSSKDAHLTALKKTKTLARPNAAKDIVKLVERS